MLRCSRRRARSAAPLPQEPIALINANVVNVRDGTVQRGVRVVLRGGRIEVDRRGGAAGGRPRRSICAAAMSCPGLIDAHVHIANLRALRTALESGVTTVRSAGVSTYVDVGMRELVKKGAVAGPDVLAAGYHVRPVVAEEAFFDHPGARRPDARRRDDASTRMRRVVQANLSRGVDWIKVLATERAGTPDTDPRKQVYTEEELRAIVDEAATKNVPVHGARARRRGRAAPRSRPACAASSTAPISPTRRCS